MFERADVLVLGAGMAGASIAAELARERRVVLLETEDRPGLHATGRSAAMFFESYGNALVRALTRASRALFEQPPPEFGEQPLIRPRSALFVADAARSGNLDAIEALAGPGSSMQRIDGAHARALCPILRSDWVEAGVLDASGQDVDVASLHQGYLRLARHRSTSIVVGLGETLIDRDGSLWRVSGAGQTYAAPILVNAAGAWADLVARRAGAPPIGLTPMRRSCVLVSAPADQDVRDWPLVVDVDEEFYFKPDAGRLLLSPANEDPSEPCDAVPDELDVAIAVDRFERATTVEVRQIHHRWAGLRSFVADRSPVAGFDAEVPGFFWLVGQGGYGIQMAPALARLAAALVLEREVPEDIRAHGIVARDVSPSRRGLRRG